MGFVASSTTVTVQAKLTAAGRKKLFDSLETVNEPFITKFALGDSDANYPTIDAGFGTLDSGFVPESGEHSPRIRSFALYQGKYKPAKPHILVNGRFGGQEGHYLTVPIGANEDLVMNVPLTTEWPRGQSYDEDYVGSFITAGASSPAQFQEFSSYFIFKITSRDNLQILFRGGMPKELLDSVIGPDDETGSGWSVEGRIEGLGSQAVTIVTMDFVK